MRLLGLLLCGLFGCATMGEAVPIKKCEPCVCPQCISQDAGYDLWIRDDKCDIRKVATFYTNWDGPLPLAISQCEYAKETYERRIDILNEYKGGGQLFHFWCERAGNRKIKRGQ